MMFKQKSAGIARERLKSVLVRDRAGMAAGEELTRDMKESFITAAEKYVELAAGESELSINRVKRPEGGSPVELVFRAKILKLK